MDLNFFNLSTISPGPHGIKLAIDEIEDALDPLTRETFGEWHIKELEELHKCLQENAAWVSDMLRKVREEEEDTIDESLALEPESSDESTPPSPTTPTTPTPAQDLQAVLPTQTHKPTTNPSHAAQRPNNNKPQSQKRRPTRAPQKRTTTGPSTRLVVRFTGQGIPANVRPHPATLRDELNEALRMRAIEGIQYSRTGQLVLHTRDPYTARQLAPLADQLWPVIQAAFRIADTPHRPIFEPDDAWTRIVVHQVPVPIWDSKRDSQAAHDEMARDFCHANSLPMEAVRHMRWLCSKDEQERRTEASTTASPTFVSIMVALHGPNTTTTTLRNKGVVMSGAHCRVTDYRERPRTRKATLD